MLIPLKKCRTLPRKTFTSKEVLFGEVGKLQRFFQVIVFDPNIRIYTSTVALVVNKHSMIFSSYSLQISAKLNGLWKI